MIWACHFVQCVAARISPVAVSFALKRWRRLFAGFPGTRMLTVQSGWSGKGALTSSRPSSAAVAENGGARGCLRSP